MAARSSFPSGWRSLPWWPAVSAFLRRRLRELCGGGLIGLATALALALVTYHPGDPSWNSAAPGPTANLAGAPGAHAADLLLQTLGLGGILLVAALLSWGWRLLTHRGLPWAWLRLTLLPAALLSAAVALATLRPPAAWPLNVGLGGVVGDAAVLSWAPAFGLVPVRLGAALLALAALLLSLGITRREWAAFAAAVVRGARRAALSSAPAAARAVSVARDGVARTREFAEAPRRRRFLSEDELPPLDAGEDGADEALMLTDEVAAPAPPRRGRAPAPAAEPEPDAPRRPPAIVARPAAPAPRRPSAPVLDLSLPEEYRLPSLDLLAEPSQKQQAGIDEAALADSARQLESVLDDFGVRGEIVKVRPGPVVTLYELEPAPGTKSSRVIGLADDIARSMCAVSCRVAVVPGRNAIGIELPNEKRETVFLRELLSSEPYENTAGNLMLALGKDIGGAPIIADLARMPHLLVAGTTGSGKSVAVNAMILSLLYRLPPDRCKFIMVDPKMLELSVYDGIPHLLAPVVTDPAKAVVALKWVVREMESRYRAMSYLNVRNIDGFNARIRELAEQGETPMRRVQTGFDPETGAPVYEEQPIADKPLPYIVVIVDEMADLMLVAGKEVEGSIQRLSQMARAAGIHLIVATQRPSVDVITGTIKANLPTRISFQVTSKIDSRTVLGEQGAEQLLGQGDMLFMVGGGRISRVHGPFVGDREVEKVVEFLREQGEPDYVDAVTDEEALETGAGTSFGGGFDVGGGSGEDLYDQAVALVCRERKASTSFVQRHLNIGYNRAAKLIERMEKEGVVGRADHVGRREVIARDIEDRAS